ncbi:ABC transporter substrate-binding protein [Haloarchaeobius salinus]|uniref:ABC transporter substrate-binding protein n=1 Tax=Haloarchaeobius salinus TaxID=1198298 RepID=UPI00210926C1|nr:ABC transporter substrate-binding protein [Haloarchaeobius salinus]
MAGLSGCLSGLTGGDSPEPLELLHAWSGGDGAAAIEALFEGFQEQHPDIELTSEGIEGAATQNLGQVINERIRNDNPPATWQNWPGQALTPFVEADALGDITDSVWSENEMESAYREGPKEQAKGGTDNYVSVPINIHRINNLFYNTSVVEEAGVDPTSLSSPSDVVDACATIASETDAVPFAHQTNGLWSTAQLWATVLLADSGHGAYQSFYEGNPDREAVVSALEIVADLSEYYPDDASSIAFTDANNMVMNGEAAFIHQGDWAAGAYRNTDGFEYGEHWSYVPFPGSEHSYQLNMDAFPYPSDNPTPDETQTFLQYCGSKDAQIRFNRAKGSIPPRGDVDPSEFPQFQQDQIEDFGNVDHQPPSIHHGLALPPATKTSVDEAIGAFIGNYDVETAADELVSAVQ